MLFHALLITSAFMFSLANANKYFEIKGCGTNPDVVSTDYKGYRIGYPLNVCITTDNHSNDDDDDYYPESFKYIENTTITIVNEVKYTTVGYITYSTTDCSGSSIKNEDEVYLADCPSVPTSTSSGAYVTTFPSSAGSTGSILYKCVLNTV
jgi:hypothetical protein